MAEAPFLRVANVQAGRVDLNELHRIWATTSEIERLTLVERDLLIVEGNGSLSQVGRCAMWDGDISGCIHQNHIIRVRLRNPDQVAWVLHWLSSLGGRKFVERVASSTSGLHTLSISKVESLPIPIAPEKEQERILSLASDCLDDVTNVEASMKRARGLMADYRASLLHAACTGALTADWRDANPHSEEDGPALLRRILAERRSAWERAELARLTAGDKLPRGESWKNRYPEPGLPIAEGRVTFPDGWTFATLDQIVGEPPRNGISVKGQNEPPGTPALRLDALGARRLHYERHRYINIPAHKATALTIRSGDLLVSRANGSKRLVGRAALADAPPVDTVFPDTMIRCRFVLPDLGPWVALVWTSAAVRAQLEQRAKTSAGIWKLGQDDLLSVVIPIPPLAEAEALLTQMESAELSEDEVVSTETQDLRQSVLHAAFSGRLVPQNPADEPAAALLARLHADATQSTPRRRARARARAGAHS